LNKIAEQDEKIKNHLSRRDKINYLVKNNRSSLENSLNALDIDSVPRNLKNVSPTPNYKTNGRKYNNYD
jgi:hypothetical protein